MKKPKILLLLLTAATLFASCRQQPQPPAGYENMQLNPDFLADVELVKAFNDALFSGDPDRMEPYLAEEYMTIAPDLQTYQRDEEIEAWVAFAQSFSDTRLEREVYYSLIMAGTEDRPELAGKWVLLWGDFHFTRLSDGRQVALPMHVAYKLGDNKVLGTQVFHDRLSMMEQLGYKVIPGEQDFSVEGEAD
jgi:hypothetical protein